MSAWTETLAKIRGDAVAADTIDELRTKLKAKCEAEGGHVFEVGGSPPWPCTFCGYNPPIFPAPENRS